MTGSEKRLIETLALMWTAVMSMLSHLLHDVCADNKSGWVGRLGVGFTSILTLWEIHY